MMDDYSPEPKWYVAHTYSGYENKVKEDIRKIVENRGLSDVVTDVRIPVIVTEEVVGDEVKRHESKVFPSYVLVKMVMNDFTWHIVRNIRGVTGFVGPGSKPVALTDDEVRSLHLEDEEGEIVQPEKKPSAFRFKVGDTVKVREGLGITELTVTEISEAENKVTGTAIMFGREASFTLDIEDLISE